MRHSELDTEFLTSPRLVLAVILAASCTLALGAELFDYPWSVVSTTMLLVVLLAGIAVIVVVLVDWSPLAGRWLTIFALSLLVHACGLWLQLPGSAGLGSHSSRVCRLPSEYSSGGDHCRGRVGHCTLAGAGAWPGGGRCHGAGGYCRRLGDLFGDGGDYARDARQITWFVDYFKQAQRLLGEALDHRAELVQTLDDLAHANRQLALMNKRVVALQSIAEEAQEAKTRFVARVSHEFRTPLNMIIGLTDLLAEKPEIYDATLSPRMRDALHIVHRNSQHLSDMVNDVLDLSRIETDHVVLHRERVTIQEIVAVAVEAVRPLLENKRLALRIEIAENVPEVYCDRTRIEQVVLNLVSNAVRYTDQGHITHRGQTPGTICLRTVSAIRDKGLRPATENASLIPSHKAPAQYGATKGEPGWG